MNTQFTRLQRFGAGLLALAFGLVFVGDSLHLALYEHVQCVEHGELVHVHDQDAKHLHEHSHEHSHEHEHEQVDLPVDFSVSDGKSEAEHDHCDLFLATQEDLIGPTESRESLQGFLEYKIQLWVSIEALDAPQIELLHRAPKLAPPV